MNSTTSSRKQIEKVSSDNQVIGFDLFSQLTYMAILSRGGVTRDRLLEYCGRQRYITAVFFEYINLMARSMGVEYTRAFQAVAQRAKAPRIKSLLLRFSASISSGSSESDFVLQEARAESEHYGNDYERNVENLRKWTDAYAAVLVAVTLIMVVSQVSSLLGSTSASFIYLMLFTLGGVTSVGVYLIYKVAPYETITYDPVSGTTPDRKLAKFLFMTCGPAGLSLGVLGFLALLDRGVSPVTASGSVFAVTGISLLPSAFLAMRDANRVNNIDQELPVFLRAIGSIAGSGGVTLTEALRRIDTKSYQYLRDPLERLRTRLESGLPSVECWETFSRETGSELVSRTSGMFVDGVEVGCNPGQIGEICSDYAQNISELRAKRKLTSSTFSFLTMTMHAVMALILVFVLEIIISFNSKLGSIVGVSDRENCLNQVSVPAGMDTAGIKLPKPEELCASVDVFQMGNISTLQTTIILAVVILTIANALAPKFSEGGNNLKIITFLAVTCLTSGVVMFVVPKVTAALLSSPESGSSGLAMGIYSVISSGVM
ncbi:MAG: type II secretion system F family protein [Chloroflexota bacterium]|nr:type II secretion system F family protein [Chloroflexota bacterium]